MYSERHHLRLNLWKWETDASPGFGTDPQDAINEQIPEHFDIFVGIFWLTIGSSTSRALSGTVEEYESAKSRYDRDPDAVRIMLYFKSELPLSLNDIDHVQYSKVVEFKNRVKNEGALYCEFNSTEDFRKRILIDLAKVAHELYEGMPKAPQPDRTKAEDDDHIGQCDIDDFASAQTDDGLFDLEEEIEEESLGLSAVANRMGNAISEVGEAMLKRTEELSALADSENSTPPSEQLRRRMRSSAQLIMKAASKDVDNFTASMKPELPEFRQHLDRTVDIFTRAVPIYLEFDHDDREILDVTTELLDSMDNMIVSVEGFYISLRDLPRISRSLVRSKREAQRVVREVIDIAKSGRTALESVLELFEAKSE